MRSKVFLCGLIVLTTFQGCSFKAVDNDSSAIASDQAQIKTETRSAVTGMSITWEGRKAQIEIKSASLKKSNGSNALYTKVITLPVRAPAVLDATMRLSDHPVVLTDLSLKAVATTGEDLNERTIGVEIHKSEPAADGTSVNFRLIGLDNLFSVDQEQKIYLKLSIGLKGKPISEIVLVLSTPPSSIATLEREIVFERKSSEELRLARFRTLQSQSEKRILLERLRLRNDSFEKVRLSVPFKTRGKLNFSKRRFWAERGPDKNPRVPRFWQRYEVEALTQEEGFYIFPLIDDLPTIWTSFSQRELDSIVLAPGEIVELGIYVNARVQAHFEKFPFSRIQKTSLSIDGYAECPADRVIDVPVTYPAALRRAMCHVPLPNKSLEDDNARLCGHVQDLVHHCRFPWPKNQDACDLAALGDDELYKLRVHQGPKVAWHGCRKSCGENCTEPGWEWKFIMREFDVGYHSEPVFIQWESDVIPMHARFFTENAEADSESRIATLFDSKWVIRD